MRSVRAILFIILSLNFTGGLHAQHNHSISFDSCFIYQRNHADSMFMASGLFVGQGNFEFYRDSIIVTFSNEWECGKYQINLYDTEGMVDQSHFIWYYKGRELYRKEDFICMLVVNSNQEPVYLELFSGYDNLGDSTFAKTTRVYSLRRD